LSAAGIGVEFTDAALHFCFSDGFAAPQGDILDLAQPLAHPWYPERQVKTVGIVLESATFKPLEEANQRLSGALASKAPASLVERARKQLEERLGAYFDELIKPVDLRFGDRMVFSGKSVLVPDGELAYDQIGLPEEMAWTLFGPLLARQLDAAAITSRSQQVTQVLDDLMAEQWILLTRAPVMESTGILAFRPRRVTDRALHIHPLACSLTNADFDGDQAAVFLPVTAAGQKEAVQLLSIAGHLRRDPGLMQRQLWRVKLDAMWGLAHLALTPDGRKEIEKLAGVAIKGGAVLQASDMADALAERAAQEGADAALAACARLLKRGFEVVRDSGASIHPLLGTYFDLPPAPQGNDPDVWDAYNEEITGWLQTYDQYNDNVLGPACLAAACGARPFWVPLSQMVSPYQVASGRRRSLRQGLTPEESFNGASAVWQAWVGMQAEMARLGREKRSAHGAQGYGVLARAAASQEVDPLTDAYSRLFVGLPLVTVS
jgi:hypothetical protein